MTKKPLILGVQHAQITIPKGAEAAARNFYGNLLELKEIPKPEVLQTRGGFWLEAGGFQIHVGTEDGVEREKSKAHLAYEVENLDGWREKLFENGIEIIEGVPIPHYRRFEFRDPFGNRVEFLEKDRKKVYKIKLMSNFPVSESVARMKTSSTFKAMQAAAALREKGFDVIDLTVGEPDFPTPEFIRDLAIEGLNKGYTKYTAAAGMKPFVEAVAHFYAEQFGAAVSPKQIAASCGGKQALFNAACTILNKGDECLIPKPYWVTFPEIGNFTGATNVYIETEETDFVLSAEQVKNSITDKTKLLIVNSPSNPSGRVIPPDEMRRIIEVCAERGVYVLTDECYLFFVYAPSEVFTSAVLPAELRNFVCVAGSFSKTYAMTGWRIGYTIASENWTNAMIKLQSHSATHPTSFVQYACARAMERRKESMAAVQTMLAEYQRRRDWLIPELDKISGFKCTMPEGAFYAFLDVRDLLGGKFAVSADVADFLLNEARVVTTDGEGFGADGFLRLSYATSMENLHKAIERMKNLF